MRKIFACFCLLVTLAPASVASRTWIVALDGSGDFTQVQPAIDAASPGDIILVKPGTYDSFILNKALTVVGSGQDLTTITDAGSPDNRAVTVRDQVGYATVASLRASAHRTFWARVSSEGRVVVWGVLCERLDTLYAVMISGSDDAPSAAWLQNVTEYHDPSMKQAYLYATPGLEVSSCRNVFVNQGWFTTFDRWDHGTTKGGAGILVDYETRAFIAETTAIGASGGLGVWGWDCLFVYEAGPGGAGIELRDYFLPFEDPPEAFVFGRPLDPDHVIRGGPGGEGTKDTDWGGQCPYYGPGGDGGEGIWVDEGSCTISGVTPEGGPGGFG
ncbi:MAG: hypothetical protein AB1486_35195, partial [Planctomycetota bacterium]